MNENPVTRDFFRRAKLAGLEPRIARAVPNARPGAVVYFSDDQSFWRIAGIHQGDMHLVRVEGNSRTVTGSDVVPLRPGGRRS